MKDLKYWKGRCRCVSLLGINKLQNNHSQSLPEFARKKTSILNNSFSTTIMHKNSSPYKETHICTCLRASYTLEAAILLPLLMGACLVCLFFFRILQVQTQVQESLIVTSRKVACEASQVDSVAILLASAEVCLQQELAESVLVKEYVKGGRAGVMILRSDLSGDTVNIKADYYIKFPINFFGSLDWMVSQSSVSQKWVGDRPNLQEETYVYVTENGEVYHISRSCHYLELSIQPTTMAQISGLRNKDGHKYYACTECVANNSDVQRVYITDYGTNFHQSLACSGLKRTIYLVPLSEVHGMGECSKCGNKKQETEGNKE